MSLPYIRFFIISLLTAFTISCINQGGNRVATTATPADTSISDSAANSNVMYGIPIDSFDQVTGHIKRNAFLSEILLEHGVSMQEIDEMTRNSRDVFDVRKIQPGKNYILFCDRDSIGKAEYMVYEHDPTTLYVFSFNDSLNITPVIKKLDSEIRYASVTIETSLWDAMLESGLHPALAVDLSDIFAWTVDFFGLQKGDNFKVIYEELSLDGKSLGTGRIYAAQFNTEGSRVTAIPFIQDGKESYFDIDGKSLRKAFLKAPLKFSRISSRFSSSRLHPILRIRRPHYGVDYAAPIGTPVHAVGDGKVTEVAFGKGSGRIVRIRHNSVYETAYMHLSRFGKGIKTGVYVKQGDIIGYVGMSGLATGPHLDFRFYLNGSPVDPLKVKAPPVEPVSEENIHEFEKVKTTIISLLGTFN
ncbi:MAG TPA: peptidoglycan DD-metalloendopeptidase family protein [Bacteroidales bacterium]|nr:peptidoglycan DD-metalloendopeptidase family protein [Bacteroidales bacterium]